MIISKKDLVNNLIAQDYHPYRVARVLGISERQVYKAILFPDTERKPKVRKPKVKR